MKVRDIMCCEAFCIGRNATVEEAARMMASKECGALPICELMERPEGILTDRDITLRCVARGRDAQKTRVCDIMTEELVCCCDTDDVENAADKMKYQGVRRLVVLDAKSQFCGIVTLNHIAKDYDRNSLVGQVMRSFNYLHAHADEAM